MKLPKHVEYFDDERSIGNGIIVTLHFGYSFEKHEHQGVMGFDTITEAREAMKKKNVYTCDCELCKKGE